MPGVWLVFASSLKVIRCDLTSRSKTSHRGIVKVVAAVGRLDAEFGDIRSVKVFTTKKQVSTSEAGLSQNQ